MENKPSRKKFWTEFLLLLDGSDLHGFGHFSAHFDQAVTAALGEGEALLGRPFQHLGESSRRYLSFQVGQAGAHHVDDHRQRVLPVELAEQSLDYVGVAELSHQAIVHFQQ